jgi:MarR-like DNA-binding transcriptional regulator SgrR of sgrS sRNA
VPQLATSYKWSADNKSLEIKLRDGVTFHDGEKMDAAAVKYNLERHRNMAGSNRRGELSVVSSVEAVDALHRARQPHGAVRAAAHGAHRPRRHDGVAQGRRGGGDKFGASPVCSGPFKFVERIAQDRITLERFPNYWNKGQIHFERVVYQPIPDATVRLANLRSGSSTSSSAWRLRRAAAAQRQPLQDRQDRRARLPGHHHQHRQERSSRRRTRSARTRACARRSSCRSTARRWCGWRWKAKRRPATSGSRRATATTRSRCRCPSATSSARSSC